MNDPEILVKDEQERKFSYTDLAPIEHLLVGSTIEYGGHEFYNASLFFDDVKDGKVDDSLYYPGSLSSSVRIKDVDATRKAKKRLTGLIPAFDRNYILAKVGKGLDIGIELPLLDESGKIIPTWKIVLLDKEEQEVKDDFPPVLDERFASHFKVIRDNGNQYLQFAPNIKR